MSKNTVQHNAEGLQVKSGGDTVYYKLTLLRNCCVSGRGFTTNDGPHRVIQEHLNNTANLTLMSGRANDKRALKLSFRCDTINLIMR